MKNLIRDLWGTLRNHGRTLSIYTGGLVIILILLGGFFQWRVQSSTFCDSCHYMDPYVRHWQASSHNEVDCVDCHDYNVFDLAGNSVLYATSTFHTRPKANVHDESCLESGCHDHRLLGGKTTYRNGIIFDHTVHLEQPLRGEELRCSSCHNQMVQFSEEVTVEHMTVNDKACFVCHFKDAGLGEAITSCDACHGMPERQVEHAGFTFDHGPYLELGVECKQCHTQIVQGDGAVPEARCYSCHVERSRAELSDEQLHAIHVTTEGIDCFRCHSDIKHGNYEMVTALDIQCESCHLRQHNRQKQLYMGIGGKDVHDMPSSMFAAQVSCAGCHTHITPEGEVVSRQEKKEAGRASCITCHGEGYGQMFDQWLAGSQKVLNDYSGYLKKVRADFRGIGGDLKARTAVREAISSAEYNYNFVRQGHIPHNIQYSLAMLNASADSVAAAMQALRSSYSPPEPGPSLNAENSCQVFCHSLSMLPEYVEYDGTEIPHELHIVEMELECSTCHSIEIHGKTDPDEEVCSMCH